MRTINPNEIGAADRAPTLRPNIGVLDGCSPVTAQFQGRSGLVGDAATALFDLHRGDSL